MKYFIMALLVASCGVRQEREGNPRVATRLIAFGDSYTAYPGSYINQVASSLNKTLINNAVNGTRLASDNQAPLILKYSFQSTDTIIMLIGFNDVNYYQVDPQGLVDFKAQLEPVVARLRDLGLRTYIGTPAQRLPEADGLYGVNSSLTPQYAQVIRDVVAGAPNIHLVDITSDFPINHDTIGIGQDLSHPSAYGHKLIADLFIQEMLK